MRWLLFLIGPCIFVHVRCQTLTADAAISAAFDLYQKKSAQITDEVNAHVSSVSQLQAGIEKLALTYGSDVLHDRFYKATSLLFNAFDRINFVVNNGFIITNKIAVLDMETLGSVYLRQCVTDNLANNLTRVIISAPMLQFTANQAVLTFKSEVINTCSSPAVIKMGKTKECLASTMMKNPPPSGTADDLETVNFLSKLYNCLQFASDKVQNVITSSLENVQGLTPSDLLYLLPENVTDSTTPNLVFPLGSSYGVATEAKRKLRATKDFIQATKDAVEEATALKNLDLIAAISSLQVQVSSLRKYVEESEKLATQEELQCYTNTRVFLHFGPKTTAIKLLQCLALTGTLPAAYSISTLETSVKERELKENALAPIIECAVDIHNVFNPQALQKCFQMVHEDYLTFLKGIDLLVDLLHSDATSVLTHAKHCVCQANAELGKAANDELYTLGECVTDVFKLRLHVPKQVCVKNSCDLT